MIADLIATNPLASSSYVFIICSVVSLWIKQDFRIWGGLAATGLGFAFAAGLISPIGLVFILLLFMIYFGIENSESLILKLLLGSGMTVLSVALAIHIVPGFSNWQMYENIKLSESSVSFDHYFNLDKSFVGLAILGIGFPLARGVKDWKLVLRTTIPILIVGIIIITPISQIFGLTKWDPKLSPVFVFWGISNLFITCVGEEAFFRGFLQKRLSEKLKDKKFGNITSLMVVSILFGVAHFAGGMDYVVLATLAGVVYGFAYQKSQKIEAAILCHFGINAFRFFLLTYPRLG